MTTANKKDRGLYGKFYIDRVDGQSEPGKKHDGCDYFVLDLTHDPFAIPAIKAYAIACAAEYPALAHDLLQKVAAAGARKPEPKAVPAPRHRDFA
jgi:hypothetical protein